MSKPINTIKIELTDLNNYLDNLSSDSTNPSITNFLMLGSELQTEGLNDLNNALNFGVDIDEIRKEYSQKLLKDVENLTKRADFQEVAERKDVPKFKQEFYEELKKPAAERSEEYKNFLKSCSNISNVLTCTELISAKMLLLLNDETTTTVILKNKLVSDLNNYKKIGIYQVSKDIGFIKTVEGRQELTTTRDIIFFKDKKGNTKILNKENFPAGSLTGEQQEFIFSMWSQGTFGAGWFMDAGKKFRDQLMDNGGRINLNDDRDFIMIDASEDGKVIVRNRLTASIIPNNIEYLENPSAKIDYTQGVLEVNISDMKGDKFTPGCSTAEPKINFFVSEFSNDYKYDIPENLKPTQSLDYDNIRKQMIEDKKQACIDEITQNGLDNERALRALSELTGLDQKTLIELKDQKILAGLKKIAVSEIQDLPQEAKIETLAVRCYREVVPDKGKQLDFAKEQLLNYCEKQDIKVLDSKEKERIKHGIVSILDPVVYDLNEKKNLDKNIGGAIRACASQENISMSIVQRLKMVIDIVFKAISIKKTIDEFKEVKSIAKSTNNRAKALRSR